VSRFSQLRQFRRVNGYVDTFRVTLTQVIEIEKEGKKAMWPPLG
jgi:hypothetical protein